MHRHDGEINGWYGNNDQNTQWENGGVSDDDTVRSYEHMGDSERGHSRLQKMGIVA